MLIGYARTSTIDQKAGLDAQLRELRNTGCEKIFEEQVSSVDAVNRRALAAALDYVRDGDTLVVTKLDRLARSMRHLVEITDALDEKDCALRILNLSIDTGTPTGRLILNVMGGIAEFERSIMLERQREGIERAKREGKYKGRRPYSQELRAEVRRRVQLDERPTAVARDVGIARSTLYAMLKEPSTEEEREQWRQAQRQADLGLDQEAPISPEDLLSMNEGE